MEKSDNNGKQLTRPLNHSKVESDGSGQDFREPKKDGLSNSQMWAYSVGHFNNDLCAAQWFVYLTWYINKVVGLNANLSGLCCLSG